MIGATTRPSTAHPLQPARECGDRVKAPEIAIRPITGSERMVPDGDGHQRHHRPEQVAEQPDAGEGLAWFDPAAGEALAERRRGRAHQPTRRRAPFAGPAHLVLARDLAGQLLCRPVGEDPSAQVA
jgi:hypothetical protein